MSTNHQPSTPVPVAPISTKRSRNERLRYWLSLTFPTTRLLSTCLVLLGFDWDSPAAPTTAAPPVVSSSSGALVPSYNEQNVHIGFVQTGPTVPGAVKREPAIGPVLVPSSKLPQLVEPLLCAQKGALEGPDRNLKFNFNEDEMNQTGRLMTLGLQQLRWSHWLTRC
ncbi:hypothetical protein C8J56DRAFT_1026851 [Mycena floridula]|nr:hypothetical protein C8J56DRAFT_1026851 [Mycena floridula]